MAFTAELLDGLDFSVAEGETLVLRLRITGTGERYGGGTSSDFSEGTAEGGDIPAWANTFGEGVFPPGEIDKIVTIELTATVDQLRERNETFHVVITLGNGTSFAGGGTELRVPITILNRPEIMGGGKANDLKGTGGDDTIFGLGGDDTLTGGIGRDVLLGGRGNDWIEGGNGADSLTGGFGADHFVIDDKGRDVVHDFGRGADRLVFDTNAGFADVVLQQRGAHTLVTLDNAQVMLRDVDATTLTQDDFLFR